MNEQSRPGGARDEKSAGRRKHGMDLSSKRQEDKMRRTPEEIERQVDQVLASFDAVPRVTASPFFATRVMARARAEVAEAAATTWFGRCLLILKPATLVALIILNLYVIARQESYSVKTERSAMIWELAGEYGLVPAPGSEGL